MKTLDQITFETKVKLKLYNDWEHLYRYTPGDWKHEEKFILSYIEGLNELRETHNNTPKKFIPAHADRQNKHQ